MMIVLVCSGILPFERSGAEMVANGLPPNGLGISGGALIDCEDGRAGTNLQNRTDLAGA